jgi:DNA-binding LacI/PurR family transcriptional regulator
VRAAEHTWWPEPTFDAVIRLLRRGGRPPALISPHDWIALGANRALQAA